VPVGFVTLDLPDAHSTASILAIAVAESQRGRGIGYGLLCSAERLARLHHAKIATAHTADFNLQALELFLRNGYRIVRRIPRFYENRFTACELHKTL
jgi:ribosomal protein S18 acetylase RimI-like enzyme